MGWSGGDGRGGRRRDDRTTHLAFEDGVAVWVWREAAAALEQRQGIPHDACRPLVVPGIHFSDEVLEGLGRALRGVWSKAAAL